MEEWICPVLVAADMVVAVIAEVPEVALIVADTVEWVVIPAAWAIVTAAWVDTPAEWVIIPVDQVIIPVDQVIIPVAWATWDISLPRPEEVGAWAVDIPTVAAAAAV